MIGNTFGSNPNATCVVCGKTFNGASKRANTCSIKCADERKKYWNAKSNGRAKARRAAQRPPQVGEESAAMGATGLNWNECAKSLKAFNDGFRNGKLAALQELNEARGLLREALSELMWYDDHADQQPSPDLIKRLRVAAKITKESQPGNVTG